EAARLLDRFGNFAYAVGGRFGDREYRRRFAFGFVDLLLFFSFRSFDRLLFFAFRAVNRRVALSFRGQNESAFFALGAHLFFHGGEDVLRRRDVLDLVAHDFDAPGLGGFVQFADDLRVDVGALLKGAVEFDLAELAAQRGLRQLGDAEGIVADAVGCALGVQDFQVEHTVHRHLNVVAGDANLWRDVDGLLLERVLVANDVEKRDQDMKSRAQRAAILAQALDDVGALLRHHHRGLGNDNDNQKRERENDDESTHKGLRFSCLPSTPIA